MKQKVIALFLIIVMVASALTAVGLATTTTVAAATTTQTTLIPSTYTPTVNQKVTFTATLKSGIVPLSSKRVTIWHYLNGVRYTDTTKTTNANGQITFDQKFGFGGIRSYYASFYGDNTYKISTSGVVKINVGTPTSVTLIANIPAPTLSQSVTFTATLKSGTALLSSERVTIYHYLNGVQYIDTTATTINGKITFNQKFGSAGPRIYAATFAGDGLYASSSSSYLTITVMSRTTLSPTAAVTGRANVGQTFSLTGSLKDQNGKGLGGQKIQLSWRNKASESWQTGAIVYTDSNGYYKYDVFFNQLATRQYQAKYAGDSTHLAASSAIWTVTWKFQPQLSLQVSNSLLPVGGTVTFSGYLKNQTGFRPGEPLVGKTITLYWSNNPAAGWNVGPTTTTDQYGYYSFGTNSAQSQTVHYYVSYTPTPTDSASYWEATTNTVAVTWA